MEPCFDAWREAFESVLCKRPYLGWLSYATMRCRYIFIKIPLEHLLQPRLLAQRTPPITNSNVLDHFGFFVFVYMPISLRKECWYEGREISQARMSYNTLLVLVLIHNQYIFRVSVIFWGMNDLLSRRAEL